MRSIPPTSICVLYEGTFPNGKRYFGISKDFAERIGNHNGNARRGSQLPVYRAMRKYGSENIQWKIRVIGLVDYIKTAETAAIAVYKTTNPKFGYNVTSGGEHNPMDILELRERQSRIAIEAHAKPETKAKFRAALKDAAPRISATMLLRAKDPIWLNNVSEGTKRALENPVTREALGLVTRGSKWVTDGITNRRLREGVEIPEGWYLGRTYDVGKVGYFWITDGKTNAKLADLSTLPEGWRPGMVKSPAGTWKR